MKDGNPSLILYITATVLTLVAKVFDFDLLMLLAKPMVVPAIYFYYLQARKRKVNIMFSIAVWLFFLSDMITLLYGPGGLLLVMACGMLSYLILIFFAISDAAIPRITAVNLIFLAALFAILGYWLYSILSLNIESVNAHYFFYLAYGVILVLLVGVSVFKYLGDTSPVYLNLCMMSLCMLISDLFYSINKFVAQVPLLDHLNLFAQFISYFFMVRYFVDRQLIQSGELQGWKN